MNVVQQVSRERGRAPFIFSAHVVPVPRNMTLVAILNSYGKVRITRERQTGTKRLCPRCDLFAASPMLVATKSAHDLRTVK